MIQVGGLNVTPSPHGGRRVTPAAIPTAFHPRDHAGMTAETSARSTLPLFAARRAGEAFACSMPPQTGTQEVVSLTTGGPGSRGVRGLAFEA